MIIDGKKQAEIIRNEIKKEISDLKKKSGKAPSLTVILIGDFAPSLIYVKNKEKSAREVGINSEIIRYPKNVGEKDILKKIEERNLARDKKDYELADKIRNELLDKGILIEDKDGKTTWKIKWAKKDYTYLIQL